VHKINLFRWRLKRRLNLFYFSFIRRKIPKKVLDKDVLFVHIPKAAGMSICKSLYDGEIGHKRAIDFYRADKASFIRIKKFAIVRDPYSRLCSAYNFLLEGGMDNYFYDKEFGKFIKNFKNFDDFIFTWLSKGNNKYKYMHFIPQTDFLLVNGKMAVDKVGKLENLSSFVSELNNSWGLELAIRKENKTKTEIVNKNYIMKNEKLKKEIYKIYKSDFELLMYDR
jgi:hypothetical protein